MSDIEKIHLIHKLDSTFSVDVKTRNLFIDQIFDDDKKKEIERFLKGYTIEDAFFYLTDAMPWMKCCNGLHQQQLPESSKEYFQTPDYISFIENYHGNCYPVLFEVKSVSRNKRSLSIMKDQGEGHKNYADTLKCDLLYAIFWEHWKIWTINTQDQFEKRTKNFKITIERAISNDISTIIGNPTYFIPKFHVKSIYSKTRKNDSVIDHKEFGGLIEESISTDGIKYTTASHLDSLITFSICSFKEDIQENGDITTVTSVSTNENYSIDLLSIILIRLSEATSPGNLLKIEIMNAIINYMAKYNISGSFKIPSTHSNQAFNVYSKAFNKTTILLDYIKHHKL